MLLRFSVTNFLSFRETATLEMVAGGEHQHVERLPWVGKFRMKILPVTAIFGGNASGKSNLVSALFFSQAIITTSARNGFQAVPFKLDGSSQQQPSRFEFEILINEIIYHYSFEILANCVLSEELFVQNSTSIRLIFSRVKNKIKFGTSPAIKKADLEKFQTIKQLVNENVLFLSLASQFKNISAVVPVMKWFKQNLCILRPDSHLQSVSDYTIKGSELSNNFHEVLRDIDSGINHIDVLPVSRSEISIPPEFEKPLKEALSARNGVIRQGDIIWSLHDGELQAQKIVSYHKSSTGEDVLFNFAAESDGTKRVLDLIPALLALMDPKNKITFIIDEIDRSLHHMLSSYLLKKFLSNCNSESRSQLIFTTHDICLLDQKLLRRDELWVMDRNSLGESNMYPLSDFGEIRYDKDLQKMYLQGYLGGVPKIIGYLSATQVLVSGAFTEVSSDWGMW